MAKRLTKHQIATQDAILRVLDAIVRHELGDDWTFDKHCERKRELLNVVEAVR